MKKYCGSLREHVMMIINFEKKKMTPLIKIQQESYEKDKNLRKKNLSINTLMIKINIKLTTIVITVVNTEVLRIAYVT